MQLIPPSQIHGRRGISVLVAVGVAGGVALAAHPAGRGLQGRVLPPEQILNGVLLASAGPAAVLSAYWAVLWRTVEPYGLSTMRRIGSAWLIAIVALSTLAPAALLARGEVAAGLGACVFVSLLWWLFIEGQRKRRCSIARDAWSDPTIDALRLHTEFVAVGVLALVSAIVVRVLDDQVVLPDLLAGVIWFSCAGLYAGVVARGARGLRVAQTVAVLYGAVSFALYDLQSIEARFALLGLGAPLVAGVLELARRRAIRLRVQALQAEGYGEEMSERYPHLVDSASGGQRPRQPRSIRRHS